MNESLRKYAEEFPPHKNVTVTSEVTASKWVDREGQVSGEIRIVRGWHAIGSPEVSFSFFPYLCYSCCC